MNGFVEAMMYQSNCYIEQKEDNMITRVFNSDCKDDDLVWHRDKKDRVVKVIYGTGWKLQYDNELPTELEIGQNYYIKKEQFHRLHKGNSELKLEIKEYE